jgi:hypothetical protein
MQQSGWLLQYMLHSLQLATHWWPRAPMQILLLVNHFYLNLQDIGSLFTKIEGIGEETEVGVDGWDEMDGAYAFCYSGNNELGLSKSVTVKCLAVGDSLMIDALSSDVDNPVHLELK